jgi:hypothetical protein
MIEKLSLEEKIIAANNFSAEVINDKYKKIVFLFIIDLLLLIYDNRDLFNLKSVYYYEFLMIESNFSFNLSFSSLASSRAVINLFVIGR